MGPWVAPLPRQDSRAVFFQVRRLPIADALKIRFLIVEDEQSVRKLCTEVASALKFACTEAASAEAALGHVEAEAPDIVLTDMKLPQMSGMDLLRKIKALRPGCEVAIMTGHGSIESAVEAMKLGAYDYIEKPFRLEQMRLFLQRMAEKVRLVAENQFLRERVEAEGELDGVVGSSSKFQDVLRMVSRLKDTRTPVLITGESGTGKELVARAIHFRGAFAHRPFVAVDCGSLVPTLVESELFGYEKGAFTGALKSRPGLFQAAEQGTVFLDEVGELPLEMQAKLLRVLQEKEVRPVGSDASVKVDVRVIAATNRDLEAAYREGSFRKDLFFRLNVVSLHVPPLRERRADIPALVYAFLERHAKGKELQIAPQAMELLVQYHWPGNVRDLENAMQHAIALGDGQTIHAQDLPPAVRGLKEEPASPAPTAAAPPVVDLEALERISIERVLQEVNGDKELACKKLGISRATLYRRLKHYNLSLGPG